ncbi:cation diffusion facilitator family transporter [Allomyces macrogynus ATCC 38327]|uniref:Cation diffusion facilitator family transporter n=1 Tax=Allomyces macrogynus (strain ATCC 38327) TaxID=578462 RepID=A0A0L0SDC6_ALLM3|nr:cation diffusion facilitator family transporter [Allomyces macrogynus ATCC 38327]|eukprot:KNE60447.1 cation diffusion facilitator family transporter [Allomyces macrogynus ATCC 38327]
MESTRAPLTGPAATDLPDSTDLHDHDHKSSKSVWARLRSRTGRISCMLAMTATFCLVQLIVGHLTGSVALVADAFHMLSDALSLVVAIYAIKLAKKTVYSANFSYGWQRAEIVGALFNGVFLLALCFSIVMEVIDRLLSPRAIENPRQVLYVGCAGLGVNIIGLFLFHEHAHAHGHGHSHGHGHGHSHGHTHGHHQDQRNTAIPAAPKEPLLSRSPRVANRALSTQPGVELADTTRPTSPSGGVQVTRFGPVVTIDPTPSSIHGHGSPRPASLSIGPAAPEHADCSSDSDLESGHGHHHHDHNDDHDHGHAHGNMNMHGVFLHVLGDALGSVAVIISAALAWGLGSGPDGTDVPRWVLYVDPLVSLIITALILFSTIPLVRRSAGVLLQVAPTYIDLESVRAALTEVDGVVSVHELHVWELADAKLVATVHVAVRSVNRLDEHYGVVATSIKQVLHSFGCHSTTIQPEFVPEDAMSRRSGDLTPCDSATEEGAPLLGCQFKCPTACENQMCCK